VAGSQSAGQPGSAGALVYTFFKRWISVGGSLRGFSAHYASLSLPVSADRPRQEWTAFVGFPVGPRVSMNLTYTSSEFRDQGLVRRTGFSGNARLSESWSLFTSGGRSEQTGTTAAYDVFVGLSYYFGHNTTGNLFYEHQKGQVQEGLRVQKSLPVGPGLGYRVEAGAVNDQSRGLGQVQYQGAYGRYEALYDSTTPRPVFTVAGGLVAIGGAVHLTRAVDDSFAVIRTPGVAGVRGYINNQEVGRTDARGDLVVPNLLSYYGNRVSIQDQDVPLDYQVEATERAIAPWFRSGALVTFPVKRIQAITGTIRLQMGEQVLVPAFGELTVTVDAHTFESPVGKQGEFYLETLAAGRHPAVLRYRQTVCRFVLDLPESPEPFLKLGELRCVMPAGETP
jgi:outer membrane usher protein